MHKITAGYSTRTQMQVAPPHGNCLCHVLNALRTLAQLIGPLPSLPQKCKESDVPDALPPAKPGLKARFYRVGLSRNRVIVLSQLAICPCACQLAACFLTSSLLLLLLLLFFSYHLLLISSPRARQTHRQPHCAMRKLPGLFVSQGKQRCRIHSEMPGLLGLKAVMSEASVTRCLFRPPAGDSVSASAAALALARARQTSVRLCRPLMYALCLCSWSAAFLLCQRTTHASAGAAKWIAYQGYWREQVLHSQL